MEKPSEFLASYSADDYRRESRLLDRYEQWAKQFRKPNGWTVIPADAKPPAALAMVDNAMRSRIERYEILTTQPESLVAYIGSINPGSDMPRGSGRGATYPVTVWTGEPIGYATRGATWRVYSHNGSHMSQFYAMIAGREYTGRGFGEGMYITLRETAESKRRNPRKVAA